MATTPTPAAPAVPPVRQKSPNYPNASLPEAIERVRRVFEGDRAAPLERDVVARHMGYSGISGAADKTIASLMQYGLMERVSKGEIRVSSRALDILHPDTPQQRLDALRAAAFAPPVFKNIRERFPDFNPSADALRSFLVRLQFFDAAINAVIASYTETCQFLERESANGSGGPASVDPAEPVSRNDRERPMQDPNPNVERLLQRNPPPVGEGEMKVSMYGPRLQVVADVDLKGARRLLKRIQASIALLEDEDEDDSDDASDA